MPGRSRNIAVVYSVFSLVLSCITGCPLYSRSPVPSPANGPGALLEYASFNDAVAGIAVSQGGRIFVSFPRWDKKPQYSVAEVQADGSLRPYPDEEWNVRGGEGILETAKLVSIDLATDRIKKVVSLDRAVVPPGSYLRKVCVDQWESHAYMSDAGTGALIVTDLDSGLPTLWSNSYFVSTVGGAPLAIIKQYIESQQTT